MKDQSTLRALNILHKALMLGQVIFAAIALYLVYDNAFPPAFTGMDHPFQVIALVISFAGVFAGSFLFKKRIVQIRDSSADIKTRAGEFRAACILQWALIEAPFLFCVICFMLAGNYAFLALAGTLFIWFALAAPSKMKTMLLLRMSEEEMEQF